MPRKTKKDKANDELYDASVEGDLARLQAALAAGADPSLPDEDHARTPAMQACCDSSAPCLEELIRAWADLNARDVNGWTAAMFAAHRGSLECVMSLAACGADLSIKTGEGADAARVAMHAGRFKISRLI